MMPHPFNSRCLIWAIPPSGIATVTIWQFRWSIGQLFWVHLKCSVLTIWDDLWSLPLQHILEIVCYLANTQLIQTEDLARHSTGGRADLTRELRCAADTACGNLVKQRAPGSTHSGMDFFSVLVLADWNKIDISWHIHFWHVWFINVFYT